MKKLCLTIPFSVLAIMSPYANAQIPVTDVASIAQQIQMVANTVQQLKTMGNQLSTMDKQLSAMMGSRGMGGLMSGEKRDYLPADWNQVTALAQGNSTKYGAIASKITTIKNGNAVITDQDLAKMSPAMKEMLLRSRNNAATQSAYAQTAYENASAKTARLQKLVDSIDGTTDTKAIADLQATIQAEQAHMQNDAIKLAQATQLQASDERLMQNQKVEMMMQQTGGSLSSSTVQIKPPKAQ